MLNYQRVIGGMNRREAADPCRIDARSLQNSHNQTMDDYLAAARGYTWAYHQKLWENPMISDAFKHQVC